MVPPLLPVYTLLIDNNMVELLMSNIDLRPYAVSTAVAGRLLGFVPPSALAAYVHKHREEFPNSAGRRIAMIDVDRHPRRHGRPVGLEELLAADRAQDADRARYRHYNSTRKEAQDASA